MANLAQVIKKALITEKASGLGETNNMYGFVVALRSNKNQIREAVERLYGVNVVKVRTAIMPSRLKRMGRFVGRIPKYKKAYVELKEGQKIEFFKNA